MQYTNTPEGKAKKAAYYAKYYAKHREELKAKKAAYNASPEVKVRQAAYSAKYRAEHREEVKEKKAAYEARPEIKAKKAAYRASPEGRAAWEAYLSRPGVFYRRWVQKLECYEMNVIVRQLQREGKIP